MSLPRSLTLAVELLVVVVLSLVLGQALGTPVGLSYVETGSMAPTMEPGDGFVAVPSQLAGPVEEGDVVVFCAEEIRGGGLTTHRVVDVGSDASPNRTGDRTPGRTPPRQV